MRDETTSKKDLTEKLYNLQGRVFDGVNLGVNFILGVAQEQLFTTFGRYPLEIIEKHIPKDPVWGEFSYYDDETESERNYKWVNRGAAAGAVLDLAALGWTLSYLAGNDSKLAKLSAGFVGIKIASFAGRKIYWKLKKNN